ncbi:MAG: PLP-dependent aminotransferase family protein [Rhodococcus sp. (in: high G+C Gram-positive bacteria)]
MLPSSIGVTLDRGDARTLPVQIADRIRAAITNESLVAGARLPSSRALSVDIGIARGVVESAYEQLIAEGWLEPRRGSGTYVRALPTGRAPAARGGERPNARNTEHSTGGRRIRLGTGSPWVPASLSPAWKRAWRDAGSTTPPHAYPDPLGESDLRGAVADLLGRARGLHTSADSIVITTGSMHGFGLTLAALAGTARLSTPILAHENPGYSVAATTAARSGWSVFGVPVDADGLQTHDLDSAPRHTAAVYVTPSHQYPTGGLLTIGRRRALADFARGREVMIIEDDYDSEFRYDVAPLPTVAELARDRTVYLGTVAKTLGAGIRLGWLVAPPHIVDEIAVVRRDTGDYPSVPVQHAMTSLLRDGEWDRTVRAARRRYRERDRIVAAALAPFGALRGVGAGMHTTLLIDADRAQHVSAAAAGRGVDVATLAESTRGVSPTSGLLIGYGSVSDDELAYSLDVLTDALRSIS